MNPMLIVLILAVSAYCVATIVSDVRLKKIPNKLTIPMFFAGWIFQIVMSVMYGWHHLGSAALGFVVGFGIFFLLWFIGSGGGGDVKLIGALSVWLGFRMTLAVLVVSTVIVLLMTIGVVIWSVFARGGKATKQKYVGTGKTAAGQKPQGETVEAKLDRRVMTFAGPVGLATWVVLAWFYPQLSADLSGAEKSVDVAVQQRGTE